MWLSHVHGEYSGVLLGCPVLTHCTFTGTLSCALCLDTGSWGDHVPELWCQGWSVEHRHSCVPVSDWKGTISREWPIKHKHAKNLFRCLCYATLKKLIDWCKHQTEHDTSVSQHRRTSPSSFHELLKNHLPAWWHAPWSPVLLVGKCCNSLLTY